MKSMKKNSILILFLLIFLLSLSSNVFAINDDISIQFDLNKKECLFDTVKTNRLYPGVEGSINISIKNSNQDVKYKIEFLDEKNKPTNLKFYYQDHEYASLSDLIIEQSELRANRNENMNIRYKWAYQSGENPGEIDRNNQIDTKENGSIYTFSSRLTAEGLHEDQINQNKLPRTGSESNAIMKIIPFVLILMIVFELRRERRKQDE